MAKFPVAEAELVAIITESITYGIHISTFATCIWTLFRTSKTLGRETNVTLLFFSITLFVIGTLDISFNIYRNLSAFIFYTGPGGANHVDEEVSNWVQVSRGAFNLFALIVADAAQIYRLWIVYGRNWRIAFPPLVLWLAGLSCAIPLIYYSTKLNVLTAMAGATKLDASTSQHFTGSSGAVVRQGVTWTQLFRIVIESTLLYTLSSIIALVVNSIGNNAFYCVSDMQLQIAGIQFDLVIIRVGLGITVEQVHTSLGDMTFRMRAIKSSGTEVELGVPVVIPENSTQTTRSVEDIDRQSIKTGNFLRVNVDSP
ncbi:uncharacterized protein LAESUDRAFT_702231 [Laetiporus sulphureus 93-53]|uniref:Uncharacterized protein n=1 Tax=Laetiporus sulphureus 93-53 TaxID=1314785 RepID=A0A165DQI8_9APHY|nr:uncharacterized protein LAESUDRAFT_702231 [Laetiporus sulphureus 93-53]KZT05406.1 hypothetical protein LAESUDRAFT_702231 [Laetiporus sulphureus 93-53]